MTVIARGADKVRALERALGGDPPSAALEHSRRELDLYVRTSFEARTVSNAEAARLAEPMRDLMLSHVDRDDPRLREQLSAVRASHEGRASARTRQLPPEPERFEPHVAVGSNFWFKAPPYDGSWASQPAHTEAVADAASGSVHLAVQSFGDGTQECAAGVMVWFFAPADDQFQRFAALLDYSDDWWDSAGGYVAHNDLRTRLWVWGVSEGRWVTQAEVSPSWSDGVGWFEAHGNDPAGDAGRVSVETFFPARANNWYQGWIWSDANAYGDGGWFGFGASSIHFDASVPFVVFGSL